MTTAKRVFLYYLGALALIGAGVIYLATSKMGPGVSTDSAMIMATGENLIKGAGLKDYSGAELTQFPPLYSIILGAGSLIFSADVFTVGWFLNVVVFGALISFSGRYLYDAFLDEPINAYFGSFVVLTSSSLISISANIASDPLFMLIVIFFLMSSTAFLRTRDRRYAVAAAALTVIGCFQRYAGLALVITGGLIAAYSQRDHIAKALASGLLFGAVTGAPIFAWGYLHNARINGTVFGARLPSVASGNFVAGAEKVLYWFVPFQIISAVGAVNLLLAIAGICAIAVVAAGARRFIGRVGQPYVVPSVVFLLVYFSVLVFDISFYELKGLMTDRVHIVALPALLVLLSAIGGHLLRAAKERVAPTAVYATAIVVFLIWSAYPISKTEAYVRRSMSSGDVSPYNSINKGSIQESALARYLHGLDLAGKSVYSNGADTTWLILRRQIASIPTLRTTDRTSELRTRFSGWPGPDGAGYIVWIKAEAYKTNYATPGELGSIAAVAELYSDENAIVYSVRAP